MVISGLDKLVMWLFGWFLIAIVFKRRMRYTRIPLQDIMDDAIRVSDAWGISCRLNLSCLLLTLYNVTYVGKLLRSVVWWLFSFTFVWHDVLVMPFSCIIPFYFYFFSFFSCAGLSFLKRTKFILAWCRAILELYSYVIVMVKVSML